MLPLRIKRVLLAAHKIDFRKQAHGLLGEAYKLGADPYDGDCVLFVRRDHRQLRVLIGDSVGLYLITRLFEGGRLRRLVRFVSDPASTTISTAELSLLLEGAAFTVHSRATAWRSSAGEDPDSSRSAQKVP